MENLKQSHGTDLNQWLGDFPDVHRATVTVLCLASTATFLHDQFHGAADVVMPAQPQN